VKTRTCPNGFEICAKAQLSSKEKAQQQKHWKRRGVGVRDEGTAAGRESLRNYPWEGRATI